MSPLNLPFDQDLDQDRVEDVNDRRRHLRKRNSRNDNSSNSGNSGRGSGGQDKNSKTLGWRDASSARTTRSKKRAEGHRRLAREVSEGMEAARALDSDSDTKEEDVRLLSVSK